MAEESFPLSKEQNITNPNKNGIKVLFSQGHNEQLVINDDAQGSDQFSSLCQVLNGLGYVIEHTSEELTSNQLADVQILVVGAPKHNLKDPTRMDLKPKEIEMIKRFVSNGHSLLLLVNAETMINLPAGLRQIAAIAGLQFQEYLNYPLPALKVFWPHYITNSVENIKVGKFACMTISNGALPLAFTETTQQVIMACANVEQGRVVAMGDVNWLKDTLLIEGNKRLATNMFNWLSVHNI